jgi:hypothetical protein
MFCTLKVVRRIEAMAELQMRFTRRKRSGPHPSITATVPVSLGTLAVAAQVSQRHQYEMNLPDIKA